MHGLEDLVVPPAASEGLARRMGARGFLHLVPGADHAFGAGFPFRGPTPSLEEAARVTLDFFRESL